MWVMYDEYIQILCPYIFPIAMSKVKVIAGHWICSVWIVRYRNTSEQQTHLMSIRYVWYANERGHTDLRPRSPGCCKAQKPVGCNSWKIIPQVITGHWKPRGLTGKNWSYCMTMFVVNWKLLVYVNCCKISSKWFIDQIISVSNTSLSVSNNTKS